MTTDARTPTSEALEDRLTEWFGDQLESGLMDLETLPRRLARFGLMGREDFVNEMSERMGGALVAKAFPSVEGPQREFSLDVFLRCALHVKATSVQGAVDVLAQQLDASEANLGCWPDQTPILAEVSLARDMAMDCWAVDGDESHPDVTA